VFYKFFYLICLFCLVCIFFILCVLYFILCNIYYFSSVYIFLLNFFLGAILIIPNNGTVELYVG
jgi:hypothetical protein